MRVLSISDRRSATIGPLVKLAVSLALFVLIFRHVNLQATFTAAQAIPLSTLLAALGLQLASNSVATVRWFLIMRQLAIGGSFCFYLGSFFKGAFFNQGLPTSIGGDGLRILDASRLAANREDAFFGVFIDRIIGLAGLLLLNLLALLANHGLLPRQITLLLISLVTAFGAGFFALYFLKNIPFFTGTRRWGLLGRLSLRFSQVYASVTMIALQTGLSVVTHLLAMLAFFLLGQAVGLDYSLAVYLTLVPPVILLTLLPLSLAGWGLRESGMVGLFLLIGADRSQILSFSISYGLLNFMASLPGLWVYLRQKHSL